jgi:histidine triad (HIT) family protein
MNELKENCIFCKIALKEIPSSIVYEDDKFFGFLDIKPVSNGHSLLIPKEHHVWMHETPDELISGAFITTKRLMNAMLKSLGCDYVQLSIVGKDVPHFHIHLIPRYFNDSLQMWPTHTYMSDDEMKDYSSKIKNAL